MPICQPLECLLEIARAFEDLVYSLASDKRLPKSRLDDAADLAAVDIMVAGDQCDRAVWNQFAQRLEKERPRVLEALKLAIKRQVSRKDDEIDPPALFQLLDIQKNLFDDFRLISVHCWAGMKVRDMDDAHQVIIRPILCRYNAALMCSEAHLPSELGGDVIQQRGGAGPAGGKRTSQEPRASQA